LRSAHRHSLYAVGGGTVEILRNTLAALEFGRSFDQRRG